MHSTGELQYSHVASDTVPNVLNIDRPQPTLSLSLPLSLGPPEKANGLFLHSRDLLLPTNSAEPAQKCCPRQITKRRPT